MTRAEKLCRTFLLLFGLVLWNGCEYNNSVTLVPEYTVKQVKIALTSDSLAFLPGSSITTRATISVTDQNDSAFWGAVVHLSLDDTAMGIIEPYDPSQGDTTDIYGRAYYNCTFWSDTIASVAIEGLHNTLRVMAGHASDSIPVYVREKEAYLSFWVYPQEISRSHSDSVTVRVWLTRLDRSPLANQMVDISVNGGRFDPWPPTNNNGEIVTHWHADTSGTYIFTANYHHESSANFCFVDP